MVAENAATLHNLRQRRGLRLKTDTAERLSTPVGAIAYRMHVFADKT